MCSKGVCIRGIILGQRAIVHKYLRPYLGLHNTPRIQSGILTKRAADHRECFLYHTIDLLV